MSEQIISQDRLERVGSAMHRLEALLDEALIVAGELNTETVLACSEGRLTACYTHKPIFSQAPAILAGIIATRGAAVDMHNGIAHVGKKLGLSLMGPPGYKGDDDADLMPRPMGRQLQVVGA